MHVHLPMYIAKFGSLTHMDTSTFEAYHKVATTGIWRRTASKRHNGLFHEMIQGIMQFDFADVLNTDEGVKFERIMNTSKFRFAMGGSGLLHSAIKE